MSNEHSSQNTFEKIFLKKKDKNLPDPGAISQVYIFWTCRIALQTLYLGTTPAFDILDFIHEFEIICIYPEDCADLMCNR